MPSYTVYCAAFTLVKGQKCQYIGYTGGSLGGRKRYAKDQPLAWMKATQRDTLQYTALEEGIPTVEAARAWEAIHAARCLLQDVGWNPWPDYGGERGRERETAKAIDRGLESEQQAGEEKDEGGGSESESRDEGQREIKGARQETRAMEGQREREGDREAPRKRWSEREGERAMSQKRKA